MANPDSESSFQYDQEALKAVLGQYSGAAEQKKNIEVESPPVDPSTILHEVDVTHQRAESVLNPGDGE